MAFFKKKIEETKARFVFQRVEGVRWVEMRATQTSATLAFWKSVFAPPLTSWTLLTSRALRLRLLIFWNASVCICEWSSRVWMQIQSGLSLLFNYGSTFNRGGDFRSDHMHTDGPAVNLESPGVRLQQQICHGSSFTHLRTPMTTLQAPPPHVHNTEILVSCVSWKVYLDDTNSESKTIKNE